jgi:hypothetical protein
VIGSTGWITDTSYEHRKAWYSARVALTYPTDEAYAWSCGRCRLSKHWRPIKRENGGIWRR